jgi:hypothetical protein
VSFVGQAVLDVLPDLIAADGSRQGKVVRYKMYSMAGRPLPYAANDFCSGLWFQHAHAREGMAANISTNF